MTPQQEAAMRQALEGITKVPTLTHGVLVRLNDVEAALTAALEQPAQQEPVAGKPLPCPFCGHIGLDFSDGSTYRWGLASCGGCGATCGEVRREYPDKGEWHSEAVAEWNRRYTRPQAREPVIDKSAAIRIATALGWEPKSQPLTDEQRREIINKSWNDYLRGKEDETSFSWHLSFDIEAAHGIKGDA